jgi:hypothetical protein
LAAEVIGAEYTVTATATNLTSVLGGERRFLSVLVIRAGSANVGTTYIGKSNVTVAANRLAFLAADESLAVDMTKAYFSSDELYVIGTAGDKLHIIGMV